MDWKTINFDWNRTKAFLVTAEKGSLSAAAKALGTTQPTLGRQVTALEDELGVVLFERVAKGLELTPSGLALLEHAQTMGDAASLLSLTANGQSTSIEGVVCISASEIYAAFILPPIITKLRILEPKITIEIIATNETSDLKKREADIALRNFRPTQPELIAKKIKDVKAGFYATPKYLQSIGHPKSNQDLSRAKFISFDNTGMLIAELNKRGMNLSPSNFPIITENYLVHWEMVKQGLGIGIMPIEIGKNEPSVQLVSADIDVIEFPIWLTTHRELNKSRRVRTVFDLLAKEL